MTSADPSGAAQDGQPDQHDQPRRPGQPGHPLRFDAISVLPAMFAALTDHGVVGRAHTKGLWQLKVWNPRDFASDAYRTIDDRPYGGGPGMVMMAEPLRKLLEAVRAERSASGWSAGRLVYLSPQGRAFDQSAARHWAAGDGLILLAGRYEGVDQRFIDRHVDEEWSIGDFVVSGGELPAMSMLDAAVRLLPGVLNDGESALQDSFAHGLLDHPHFTRPEILDGEPVPPVLLSGHHKEIERWRRQQALLATRQKRPELLSACLAQGLLSAADLQFLRSLGWSA